MKSIENLTKYYGSFTPMERLNLVMAAGARNDEEEMKKLFQTCPRLHYIQVDQAFLQAYDQMTRVNMLFILHWEDCCYRANAFSLMRLYLISHTRTHEQAIDFIWGDETKQTVINEEFEEIDRLMQEASKIEATIKQQIAKLKSTLEAYRQFCNEVGIQAEYGLKNIEARSGISFEYPEGISIDKQDLQKICDETGDSEEKILKKLNPLLYIENSENIGINEEYLQRVKKIFYQVWHPERVA